MSSKRSVGQQTAKVSKSSGVPLALHAPRGVKTWKEAVDWLKIRGIEDIECITPDLAGVARGKMMPTSKFTSNTSLALPSAIYRHTISGEYPERRRGNSATIRATATSSWCRTFRPFPSSRGKAIQPRR
ncbi:hypothetical protein ABIE77_003163 [Sinorhizobium fredii]